MRLAFSTLGCPSLLPPQVAELAADAGYAGVELRAADDSAIGIRLTPAARREAARAFRDHDVTVLAVASYVQLGSRRVSDAAVVADLLRHVELATDLGATFVRVFAGSVDTPARAATPLARQRLASFYDAAGDVPCIVAVETHDGHARVADVCSIAEQVGMVWDCVHSIAAGEPAPESARLFHERQGYLQVKDFRAWQSRTPAALGTGVVPLDVVLAVLAAAGYRGWVSWEHEAYWHAEAAELDRHMLVAGRVRLEAMGCGVPS